MPVSLNYLFNFNVYKESNNKDISKAYGKSRISEISQMVNIIKLNM